MRLGLVANTRSGGSDRVQRVEELLREAGAQVEEIPLDSFCRGTDGIDEDRVAAIARRLSAQGETGADRIVVAGGDGTLGPGSFLALRAGLPVAVVPVGTANSFARWMGLPLEVERAAALAATPGASVRRAEVASAGGRPFVNVAATGLSVLAAHRALPLKRRFGTFAYALGAARAAATGRPLHTAVTCDGRRVWDGAAWQVLVAASGAFGGDSSTGGVDPGDEVLDVAIVPAGPRRKLLRRAYAMRRGRLVGEHDVVHERGGEVALAVEGERSFNVDGEVLRLPDPRFRVVGRVEVVVP